MRRYTIEEFTEKDLFECRLACIIPDFGYISESRRRIFFDFLLRMGLMTVTDRWQADDSPLKCKSNMDILYQEMATSAPIPARRIITEGMLYTVSSSYRLRI